MPVGRPFAICVLALASVIVCVPALAQPRRLSLIVAYPATVGVQWALNDRFVLRADGNAGWSLSETVPGTADLSGILGQSVTPPSFVVVGTYQESRSVTGGIGFSTLITLAKADRFTTYVAPRVAWSVNRTSTRLEYDIIGTQITEAILRQYAPESYTVKQTTPAISTVLGVSAGLHERFGMFAEAGLSYSWSTLPRLPARNAVFDNDTRIKSVGLRSGIGAIVYF